MKAILRLLLIAAVFVAVPATVALAHGVTCYTAVGYTVTCQPKPHAALDPYGNVLFGFNTGATYTQTQLGSFTWNAIRLTGGYENTSAQFGDTYIFQFDPNQTLLYSRVWFCREVNSVSDEAYGGSWYNASTSGQWFQYSTAGIDCYTPNPYTDALMVQAY